MLTPQHKSLLCICTAFSYIELGSSFICNNEVLPNVSARYLRKSTQTCSPLHDVKTSSDAAVLPPGILGPPEPLRSLKVGQIVHAFRALQYDDKSDTLQFTIERVSGSPDIFCLRNFVTPSECTQIQKHAKESGMEEAGTITKGDTSSRKRCSVAWLSPSNGQRRYDDATHIVNDLVSSTANMFLSKEVMSHPSAGVEDMQVLKYGTGGEFVHHHDGEPRVLTVIYYINGVGGTWFPLAHTNNDECKDFSKESEPLDKAGAMDLVKGFEPGKDGLLAKGTGNAQSKDATATKHVVQEENEHIAWVNQGDAIAFYNYKDDGSGKLDWKSLHCGLPTSEEDGTKWIANHWYGLNVLADL